MALPAGQLHAALAYGRVVAHCQPFDKVVGVCRPCRRNDLVDARIRPRVCDVVAYAGGEQYRLLKNDGELVSQVGEPVFVQVRTVEKYRSVVGVVEARDQAGDRSFARARDACDAQPRAGLDAKRHPAQHRHALVVGKGHVAKLDLSARSFESPGVGTIDDVRDLVEYLEDPLCADYRGLQRRGLPADVSQGTVELRQVRDDHEQLAKREHACLHVAKTDEQHDGRPDRGCQVDEQPERALGE